MKKIFLVVFLVIMGLLGCLVSCSRDDGEYTTGTLVIEVDYWSAYWNNKLYVRIYPLGQEKLGAIKVLEFGNKHSVSVDLNPGNYSVNVFSTSETVPAEWTRSCQIQAGRTELLKLARGE